MADAGAAAARRGIVVLVLPDDVPARQCPQNPPQIRNKTSPAIRTWRAAVTHNEARARSMLMTYLYRIRRPRQLLSWHVIPGPSIAIGQPAFSDTAGAPRELRRKYRAPSSLHPITTSAASSCTVRLQRLCHHGDCFRVAVEG